MDFTLRCNSLKCRSQLAEQAVVTTCSHIFCLQCASNLGLSTANSISRACPACKAQLPNQDDAAVIILSPSEDYKTTVLSGLNPTIIIECASRAMAFWTYQTTQEIFYHEFLMKSMSEKYQSLSGQMDQLVSNANAEVSKLHSSLQAITLERNDLHQKNQTLSDSYSKKCKDNQKLTKLYQQEKQKAVAHNIAEAAEDDVSHFTRQLGGEFRPGATAHHGLGISNQSKPRSDGSNSSRIRNRMTFGPSNNQGMPPQLPLAEAQRAHLPGSQHTSNHLFRSQVVNESMPSRIGTPFRQPLGQVHHNVFGQSNADQYGMPNGTKHGKSSHQHLRRESTNMPFGRDRSIFGR